MCSNTDSPGRNGDGGGSWSPNSKKKAQNKRQRVPKRGPGVAELEKILREQEKKTEDDDHHLHNQVLEGRFNSCFISNDHSQPLIPMTKSIVLPPPSLYGNATGTNSNSNNNKSNVNHALLGRCIDDIGGGGGGGGSAVFLPEGALLPVTWTTAKTKTNINEEKSDGGVSLPNSTVFSNEYYQLPSHKKQPTSIMNHFSGSTSSSSIPSSFELCHQIEPPSSQRSYNQSSPSMRPQGKVIGMKRRPPPLLVDNPPAGSVCQYQIPQVPSHRHIPYQATSFNRNMGYNLNFNKPLPRDTRWDVPLEFDNLNNSNTEYGTLDGNFFKFVPNSTTPVTVLPPFQTVQQHFSKFDYMLPFPGSIKDSNQVSISAESGQNKPFYSFLPAKEQMGTKERLRSLNNTERGDKAGEDNIDLNLKLSTHN